ncbi:MAG: energy-coupling factor ABC transporter ATP-binding protein [Sphaerochaetaceae bacterium]
MTSIQSKPALFSVEHLCFSFSKEKSILKDISFSINQGSFTLISGPNGAGKSILLRCLKGILKPSEGSIFLAGEDVTKNTKKRLHSIGLVFQDADTQIVGQTVEKDIRFGMENLGLEESEQKKRLEDVLALMHLQNQRDQRPRTLSGGEKRKLSIAGILVMDPKLIILDEPFANLDYRSAVGVLHTLLELQSSGHTVVIVSHEVDKILAHADQVLVMEAGRIVEQGTKQSIIDHLEDHGIYIPRTRNIEDLSWLKH